MTYATTADGTQLYVKDWGNGQPVIMIHGWPLSADSWDDLALALVEAGYRAIAYDRRGFGRSSQPWDGYDYDTLADDLAAVIAHTGAKQVVLAGFSMGGGEVARFLTRHGSDNVAKAVLVSSVLPFRLQTSDNPDGTPQAKFDETAQTIRADRAKFFGEFFPKFFGPTGVSEETVDWARNTAMQAGLRPTLGCQQAFATTDFRPDLASFTMPTLIIHGTDDKIVPIDASSRKTAHGIPCTTLIEYEGGPHGLFASHRERLARDLLGFLGRA